MFNEDRLNEEIKTVMESMSKLDPSSDEYAAMNKNLAVLMDRAIEIEKLHIADAQNEQQQKTDNLHRFIGHGLNAVQFIGSLGATITMGLLWMRYDSNGNIPSGATRKLLDKAMNFIKK